MNALKQYHPSRRQAKIGHNRRRPDRALEDAAREDAGHTASALDRRRKGKALAQRVKQAKAAKRGN